MRRSVIEAMVRDAVLKQRVEAMGYRVSDERLTQAIRSISAFQVDGEFSMDVYRGLLRTRGSRPTGFEALQRESLEVRELQSRHRRLHVPDARRVSPLHRALQSAARDRLRVVPRRRVRSPASRSTTQRSARTTRAIRRATRRPKPSISSTSSSRWRTSRPTIDVSDEALRAAYDEERERFQTAEERRARHILIAVENGDEDAARAKAEELAAARAQRRGLRGSSRASSPTDAGTKAQGGDLGWIGRGMLAGPFEDALFEMQTGEVRGPVRSDFGYHVIRLDELRAGTTQPFEAVRDELASELRTRRAEQQFYDRANQLGDKAFDAYNELATVASEMQLPLEDARGFPADRRHGRFHE